jgi:phosphoenolpyruvate carboxykinase (GTP)
MRVLKWMLDRIEGQAPGQENIFGVSPTYGEINWTGLEFSQADFDNVISIDKAAWGEEIKLHEELFEKLQHHLPQELVAIKEQLKKALA